MSFIDYLNEELVSTCFKGVCDKVRKTPEGEDFWQEMMKNKEEVSEDEFIQHVNPVEILDADETWEQYIENARMQDPDLKFYKAPDGIYFFQTVGFEFIWQDNNFTLKEV